MDYTADPTNILATIVYYAEVAESGGLTPFCSAGVAARPIPGSAVFWQVLKKLSIRIVSIKDKDKFANFNGTGTAYIGMGA